MRIRGTRGFTLIELLIVVTIVGVLASVAAPGLIRARMSGNEASAISSLRAINSSQQAYSAACANGFYAPTLMALGTAPSGGTPFISADLATRTTPTKSGYTIGMTGLISSTSAATAACNAVAAEALSGSYWANASPNLAGSSGTRYFWTNTLGAIYTSTTAPITDAVGTSAPAAGSLPLQ